ncbi:DUF6153 family protein [Kibdelosporangium lantanae]|uniref:DUF6153 family protein n=1 Tax=Kibdelosporangium lantanae TaxID=1497396 RepID=A0ABW3MDY9_9PSEU
MSRSAAVRWVLLGVLAFGLIGMHSLVMPGHAHHEPVATVQVVADDCCSSDMGHDMTHMCLAVLVLFAGLMLVLLLWFNGGAHVPAGRWENSRGGGRGPPRPTLSSLCVSRQ